MPPRRARVPETLESRIKQGLQYIAALREDAVAAPDRVESLNDALQDADLDLVSSVEVLGGIVAAHGWAARALAADMTSIPALVVHQITAIKLQEVLRSRQGDPAGDQLVLALLRADTLAVYARLLAQTLATTRAAAARRGAATLYRSKLMLVMHVVDALRDVAECVGESSDAGLQQELVTALAHTQLLEHAVRALLHVAQATPAATGAAAGARASATSSATGTSDGDWTSVSQTAAVLCKTLLMCFVDNVSIASLCPRSRERDTLHDGTSKPEQLRLLEQMRPLLAAPGVQLFAGWAGLCAAMAVRQGAADGSIQQGLAPPVSQLRHGLPPKVVRPFQPPRTAEQLFIDMSGIGMVRTFECVCLYKWLQFAYGMVQLTAMLERSKISLTLDVGGSVYACNVTRGQSYHTCAQRLYLMLAVSSLCRHVSSSCR